MGRRRASKRGSGGEKSDKSAAAGSGAASEDQSTTPAKKMAKAAYDWNVLARAFRIHPDEPESWEQALTIDMDQSAFVKLDEAKRIDLAMEEKLRHGDVLVFGDYRYTDAYFVQRTEGGVFNWIKNDHDAGYLTVPLDILSTVTNFATKYADILKGNLSCNVYISPLDKWIEQKYGADVPDTYAFNLQYVAGALDEIYVKAPGADWSGFTPDKTWEDIKSFFEAANDEQNKFSVEVSLQGEKFTEYKEKHGKPNNKYAWLTATPKLPKGWQVEKGASAAGPDNASWTWNFSGTAEHYDAARQATTDFLEGFSHKFI